jgi:hypothetical protein
MSSVWSWFESPLESSIAHETSEFSTYSKKPIVSGYAYISFLPNFASFEISESAAILILVTEFLRCRLPLAGRFHPRAVFQALSLVGQRILGPYQRLWHWPVPHI